MTMIYGTPSSVGPQITEHHFIKKALIEAQKEQYFQQMADTTTMPKNMGKKIKQYHYIPMLDDANINDQGLDASGASVTVEKTIIIQSNAKDNIYTNRYAIGSGATSGAATTAAQARALSILNSMGVTGGTYAAAKTAAEALGWVVDDSNLAVPATGNLYGSSKDIGYIAGKMPALSENGGRVNRVGFKRREIEGTFQKYGVFDEYTKESLDFDTDEQLLMHITREMVNGGNELTEDLLQIDLLNAAGVVRLGGTALTTAQLSGETGSISKISYKDLMKLEITLDNNRCPKKTTVVTGSSMTDTRTIEAARYMFIGSELIPEVKGMTDLFGNPAFIGVEKYGAATTLARGEIGSVGGFRIVVVPEMMHWAGAGATATAANAGYRETGGKYDVFPMLVVGDQSFTTIAFNTDGKSAKFTIKHVKPESDVSYGAHDPYGEKGFMSLKFYYGFMPLRPERIALCKTVAQW